MTTEQKLRNALENARDYIDSLLNMKPDEATDSLTNNGEKVVDEINEVINN